MQIPSKLKPYYENVAFSKEDGRMIINLGPQHPSSHGNLRLVLELDGEKVVKCTPMIGYMHRGMEKMAENMIYQEFIPTTDRMDYVAASANNYAYVAAVEKLCGLEIPRRAQIIRMMLLELNRLASHLLWLATHALDIGAMTVFLYCFREREYVMDLIEKYCGARLTHSSMRIGGAMLDLPANFTQELLVFCDKFLNDVKDYETLLDDNRIWRLRTEGVGVVTKEQALSWGCSGVMLRGSGIEWDIRKEEPYLLYNEVQFGVPFANQGDTYARYKCYMQEFRESVKILRQLVPMYRESSPELICNNKEFVSASKEQIMTQNYSLMQHFVLVTQGLRPPVGDVYVPTESPKGELGYFIKSDGSTRPYRLKARTPSFWHCSFYEELLVGTYVADVVAIMGSTNIVLGEIDR
ncbi:MULTISPECIES: NADH dehydrogenase (quinone) subunit D [unclassified Campylobacter]|uniref:NADH dehydrogenase (quinone) subunit D n=1 Tax=unclassified Campylobacter TaxID=2593542 RepID=UPI001DF91843|nr:NADH dehydrogenase (quinone) subunit D [Campylobacter sp. RM9331]MBZ8005742.1 NADH dehydrogenase (quinone) subunit D [Campylobacter sp. RM9332]